MVTGRQGAASPRAPRMATLAVETLPVRPLEHVGHGNIASSTIGTLRPWKHCQFDHWNTSAMGTS